LFMNALNMSSVNIDSGASLQESMWEKLNEMSIEVGTLPNSPGRGELMYKTTQNLKPKIIFTDSTICLASLIT
jgi:hypothetical protein